MDPSLDLMTIARFEYKQLHSLGDIPLDILCGEYKLQIQLVNFLKARGFVVDTNARNRLIVDTPCGFAYSALEHLDRKSFQSIVFTWNTCPEYLQDLLDFVPSALLTPDFCYQQRNIFSAFYEILALVAEGGKCYHHTEIKSKLTHNERMVLRYIARGWKTKQVGLHLGIAEQTVRNYLRNIYGKLGVDNHSEAIIYYWQLLC